MKQADGTILTRALARDVSRRGFLRGLLGTAAASTVALAGCGSTGDDTGDATGDAGTDEAPATESVIRFGVSKPDASFDTQTTSTTIGVSENVTEGLYELDPKTNEVKPVIAADLPTISDDGLTYEIELKEGVKFHDGTTLTADDVKYTFTRLVSINAEADSFSKIEGFDDRVHARHPGQIRIQLLDGHDTGHRHRDVATCAQRPPRRPRRPYACTAAPHAHACVSLRARACRPRPSRTGSAPCRRETTR